MLFTDRLTLGQPRTTNDGYLAVRARAARSGVYEYVGREIDPDATTFAADQVVRVYRPEDEVFSADSVASFLMKPVTNDHPSKPVTADNWRQHAKGVVGKALRDGEFLAFDIVIMDKATIKDVEDGKRELSNGYASEISFESGQSPGGQRYDAVQRKIRGNHVAVVDKGRAGADCRIGDCASCAPIPGGELEKILTDHGTYTDENPGGKNATSTGRRETPGPGGGGAPTQDGEVRMPHTLIIDGLQVPNVSDEAKAAIEKLQGQVTAANDAKTKVEGERDTALTDKAKLEGEKTVLEQKVKDAEISPEKLQQLVADRSALVAQAKAIDPKVVTDGKSEAEIKKAVVTAKLGDAAKDMADGAIDGAFAAYAKDAKVETSDPLRDAITRQPINVSDTGASVRDLARSLQHV